MSDELSQEFNLYTIGLEQPFLKTLCASLWEEYKNDPLSLSAVTIYLPTRRSARSFTEIFLDYIKDKTSALLLPDLKTLGGFGEDDLSIDQNIIYQEKDVVSPLERKLTLANFIYKRDEAMAEETGRAANWSTSIAAAGELSDLLGSFYTEEISFDELLSVVPEDHSHHWDLTLDFLKIVSQQWPNFLEAQGKYDPTENDRDVIDQLRMEWEETPPKNKIIIAGSTGSRPAIARLMRLVASLPKGQVILPGLDTSLDEKAWEKIEDPHPQAGMKRLLERYFDGLSFKQIKQFSDYGLQERRARKEFISLALRPAEATDDWLSQLESFSKKFSMEEAINGVSLLEAYDEAAEAQSIALKMRETLLTPEKTALLVTPDRTLARRVSAHLKRWSINLDDSAGVPFSNTLRGNFLRLTADWLSAPEDPIKFLSLLKHPLSAASGEKKAFAKLVSSLDMRLRGFAPKKGFAGLRVKLFEEGTLVDERKKPFASQKEKDACEKLLAELEEYVEAFQQVINFSDRLKVHLGFAEYMAGSDEQAGKERLWAFEDGRAGARHLGELFNLSAILPSEIKLGEYLSLFETFISGLAVRTVSNSHPRLKILGPIEARLQQADVVILGGLNEGTWPDEAKMDPFLSRPIRRKLGLPSPENRVGLSALDFSQAACAPEVFLTRAERQNRAPAKASRWIVRLKNILTKTDDLKSIDKSAQYEQWCRQLDKPEAGARPTKPPMPTPPVEVRPTSFAVTAFEKLMRDPYAIYARSILRIFRLDSLANESNAASQGTFYHALLEYIVKERQTDSTISIRQSGEAFIREMLPLFNLPTMQEKLWMYRLDKTLTWFEGFEEERKAKGKTLAVEARGEATITIDNVPYKISARADRIDQQENGVYLIDYKTGTIPTVAQEKTGFSPQLQLTAMIAEKGGFKELPDSRVDGYGYYKILNRKEKGNDNTQEGEVEGLVQEAEESLVNLLTHYRNENTPYPSQPRSFFVDQYGDYDLLARRPEWSNAEDGEEA